jgi:TatA/E family protein of Tat protein translocase
MGLDNPLHIAFLVVILLLVFGARRLPEIGRSLGSGMREFKQGVTGETHSQQPTLTAGQPQQPPAQPPVAQAPAQAPVAQTAVAPAPVAPAPVAPEAPTGPAAEAPAVPVPAAPDPAPAEPQQHS